ncbi:MAG: PsbP-related protein [Thermomicrobiales bacterium]
MHRRYALPVIALLLCTALLAACGGSTATNTPPAATNTPQAAAPTIAPTTAPTTVPTTAAASAAAATRPAATTAPTTAPTAASAVSTATATRPASSAVTGTRPAGTAAAGSAASGSLTLFTDPKGRFSFSRPAAWTVGQSTATGSVVQFNSTNPLGVVDISTESVASGTTPDKYLAAGLVEIKKNIPDAQQVGTLNLQLDSEPAVQIDYTGTVNGSKVYFSQIFALHKGTAYILTLGTQPADINAMKQQAIVVVQTWKFLQ